MPLSPWFRRFAALGLLCALALAGCGGTNQYKAPPPAEVTVAKPVTRDVNDFLEFTGYTRATQSVDIRARVSGYLKSIKFEDGAMVNKDDLLFQIEPEPFQLALAAAKANLQKAQAAMDLADAELKRTEPLAAKGALTQQELDTKVADKATAVANVAAAKAQVDQAEWNLQYTEIRSPVTGRVGRHMVDIGNLILAEQTSLTRIEAYKPIYAYFNISENDLLRLRAAQPTASSAGGDVEGATIHLGLSNQDQYPYKGHLDFEDTGVDPGTGTQMRRGIFANGDLSLLPGMFVRVRMPVGQAEPRLLVPERAIAADQRGEYLLVVNDKNVVEYRPVQLGIRVDGGMRVVRQGIDAADRIVVNGVQRARPGSTVNPKDVEQKPATQTAGMEAAAPARSAENKPADPASNATASDTPASKK